MSAGRRGTVIAGAGLAGVRTAQTLRDLGYEGRIRLFSEESELPYDRPPLSKAYLTGRRGGEAIRFEDRLDAYTARGIELVLGKRVVAADLSAGTVGLADGSEAGFDRLVVATGSRPREPAALPPSPTVHYLRTAADSRRLAGALTAGRRVVLVGGGFIGLEVACAARALGCEVTVVEAVALPLATAVGEEPARRLMSWHTARGIAFRCGVTVRSASAAAGARILRLDDGSQVTADVVVVGVGVVRDTGWLSTAGLGIHHGLVCDHDGRASDPAVFGVGDVVCRHDGTRSDGTGRSGETGERGETGGSGACRPIGHWTAAADSAVRVAGTITGGAPAPVQDDGFFWSDQGDLRLQFAGYSGPGSEAAVVSGALDADAFVVHYTDRGRLTGVFAANSPREFLRGRMALRSASGAGLARTAEGSGT
ncbi:NAD(P)/FAD-dependent oxidoreductase [Streptomyces sp. NPDC127033]|uniref:NAD(P)/FAD-dependent oxidoreductase n=1 Tax=Streptomyces sp. NPDC127033 TaxID=3347110 RepID=UPI0036558851